VTGGKPIAVLLQSISGVSAINPLVAFYDTMEERERCTFLLFCPGHHTELRDDDWQPLHNFVANPLR
jgi:hypothetical protein